MWAVQVVLVLWCLPALLLVLALGLILIAVAAGTRWTAAVLRRVVPRGRRMGAARLAGREDAAARLQATGQAAEGR